MFTVKKIEKSDTKNNHYEVTATSIVPFEQIARIVSPLLTHMFKAKMELTFYLPKNNRKIKKQLESHLGCKLPLN